MLICDQKAVIDRKGMVQKMKDEIAQVENAHQASTVIQTAYRQRHAFGYPLQEAKEIASHPRAVD